MKRVFVLCASSAELRQSVTAANLLAEQHPFSEAWIVCLDPDCLPSAVSELSVSSLVLLPVEDCLDCGTVAAAVCAACGKSRPDLLVFEGTSWGDEQAVLAGHRLQGASATCVREFHFSREGLTVSRPVCSGSLTADFLLSSVPCCISLERSGRALRHPVQEPDVTVLPRVPLQNDGILESRLIPDKEAHSLADAPVVLAVERGVGSREGMEQLRECAAALHAEVGGSRAVTMNGWAVPGELIGVSGHMIAPRLCLAAGVSGAAAFSAGVQGSKIVVAVNTDPEALVFGQADFGIVADCRELFSALAELYQKDPPGEV